MDEIFQILICNLLFLSRINFLPQSTHLFSYGEEPVSAAHTFDPVIFLSCLHVIFPALAAFLFRKFRCLLIMNICLYCLLSLHFVTLQTRILGLFTLSLSLLFDFVSSCFFQFASILLLLYRQKDICILSIKYFLGIFGTGLIFFKSLEEIISSWEVSEGSIVLRST